jgi:hypothetical protein
MSNIADVSNALLELQENLKSLKTVVDAINTAKDVSVDSLRTSYMIVERADELTDQVQKLVGDVNLLDFDSKLEPIKQLIDSLRTGIDAIENGFSESNSKLSANLEATDNKLSMSLDTVESRLKAIENDFSESISNLSANLEATDNKLSTSLETVESRLKADLDTIEKNMVNIINLAVKPIDEKISVMESLIRELQVAVLKQQLDIQEYSSKLNKSILVMQILAGIALVLIIVQIVLNYVG